MRKVLFAVSVAAILAGFNASAAEQDEAAAQQERFETKCRVWAEEEKIAQDKVAGYVAQCVEGLKATYTAEEPKAGGGE